TRKTRREMLRRGARGPRPTFRGTPCVSIACDAPSFGERNSAMPDGSWAREECGSDADRLLHPGEQFLPITLEMYWWWQRRRGGLDPGACEHHDYACARIHLPALLHPDQRRHRRCAFRRGPDPFQARDHPLRVHDLSLGDRPSSTAGLAKDAEHLTARER